MRLSAIDDKAATRKGVIKDRFPAVTTRQAPRLRSGRPSRAVLLPGWSPGTDARAGRLSLACSKENG